jgi:histidinol-phosphate phosphatase family protein
LFRTNPPHEKKKEKQYKYSAIGEMMKKRNVLICVDRDGTIIFDDKYFLGRQKDWKKKIRFFPRVSEGIKKLRKIKRARIHIITNQPGVAISDFPLLTKRRAHNVTREVIRLLKAKGARLDGYEICPHAPPNYSKSHPGKRINKKLVCKCSCIKPKTGMVRQAMRKEGLKANETEVYVIGDRATDVKTALNMNGFGILVPFFGTPRQIKRVKKMKDSYIARDFLDAAEFIYKRERN